MQVPHHSWGSTCLLDCERAVSRLSQTQNSAPRSSLCLNDPANDTRNIIEVEEGLQRATVDGGGCWRRLGGEKPLTVGRPRLHAISRPPSTSSVAQTTLFGSSPTLLRNSGARGGRGRCTGVPGDERLHPSLARQPFALFTALLQATRTTQQSPRPPKRPTLQWKLARPPRGSLGEGWNPESRQLSLPTSPPTHSAPSSSHANSSTSFLHLNNAHSRTRLSPLPHLSSVNLNLSRRLSPCQKVHHCLLHSGAPGAHCST